MIILDTINRKLEMVLAGAITTNQLTFMASYRDFTVAPPATNQGISNSTTAVTLVAAPATGAQRTLEFLSIYNKDTVAATVTVRLNDNATLREIFIITLSVGDTLIYTENAGWSVINSSGQVKTTNIGSSIGARVYNSAAISIPNNAAALLTFDSERRNDGNLHSTSVNTGRLTASVAGWYNITAMISFANNATGVRFGYIRLNGGNYIAINSGNAINGFSTVITVATGYYLAVNDYVELQAYQNSGGALNVELQANYSPEFAMVKAP